MRHQDHIYIQNDISAVKNKDILNFSTSSDFSIFVAPTYLVKGATKVPCNTVSCSVSGLTEIGQIQDAFSAISQTYLTTLTGSGVNLVDATGTTCFKSARLEIDIFKDDNLVYSSNTKVATTWTDSTSFISSYGVIQSALSAAYSNLEISYSNKEASFNVSKPYGVENLKASVGLYFNVKDSCTYSGGSSYSGTSIFSNPTITNYCDVDFFTINSGSTGVYIVNTATTIPVTFQFTGNTKAFIANNINFKYEVFKFDYEADIFGYPSVYLSDSINYTKFSKNSLKQEIPISNLKLDGEYLIKGYYEFNTTTEYLSQLGKKGDTSLYKSGEDFQLYEKESDYYFLAIKEAEKPTMVTATYTPIQELSPIYQQIIFPRRDTDGTILNSFLIDGNYKGDFVLSLNGLTMAMNSDYTLSGSLVTMNGELVEDDLITVTYNKTIGVNLYSDVIRVTTAVVSGVTDSQGNNKYFYNTTTGKYEIYLTINPVVGSSIVLMLNGATLASGVDYYQSTTNIKRIILEGDILEGDIITTVYYPQASVINGVSSANQIIGWRLYNPPQTTGGTFILEISTNNEFTDIIKEISVPYQIGVSAYNAVVTFKGKLGTVQYYRVKNLKEYRSICGDKIESLVYGDVIPITITSNTVNTY